MKTFNVTLAFNVSCYATIEVEAHNQVEAKKLAIEAASDTSFEPAWETADDEYRLVNIEQA